MYQDTSRLIMYSNISGDSVLMKLSDIFKQLSEDTGNKNKDQYVREIYNQVYRLLDIATRYGFDRNLWHCYIAFLLAMDENPFSVICEKVGMEKEDEGKASVTEIVKQDMQSFYRIFHYDFSKIEELLSVKCFSILTDYRSMAKDEHTYNKSVSEKVKELAAALADAVDGNGFFEILTNFYKKYGVGKFGLNKAFRVVHSEAGQTAETTQVVLTSKTVLTPITHTSDVSFSDLVGYELQKEKLIQNTEAFVEGRKANNCLLFGDSGTGKSTCIKAVLNQYYDKGLRLIEVYKHQFQDLSNIMEQIKNRNYKFIIYMDDLSFEEFEIEYKYLKAVIEGGLEVRPDNVLIYATSNRRHLIRETWGDRSDMSDDELHRSDTMQEKLSLVARFGVTINFSKPSRKEFEEIVLGLAAKNPDITLSSEEICMKANAWSIRNGGYSGRVAEQFITHLKSAAE
ncbi:MAG: ATP-binding protein [Roseburia sp.]|nr:ATP-binding protein [Roseburia sp.]